MQRPSHCNFVSIQKFHLLQTALLQANEFKIILQSGEYFPNDFPINIAREIKLLGDTGRLIEWRTIFIDYAVWQKIPIIFSGGLMQKEERPIQDCRKLLKMFIMKKSIKVLIDEIVDETGVVKDNASEELRRSG